MRYKLAFLATMAIGMLLTAACGRGITTGTYRDPVGSSAFVLRDDNTFSMVDLTKCERVEGTYSVVDNHIHFELAGASNNASGPTEALQSMLDAEIGEDKDAFSILGLRYVRRNDVMSLDGIPCWNSNQTTGSTAVADSLPPVSEVMKDMPTVKADSNSSENQTAPRLVIGPKPSGRGTAPGLYAQDGSFIPGEYIDGTFTAGVRGPSGQFIPGKFASGGQFIPDAAANGGGFLQ